MCVINLGDVVESNDRGDILSDRKPCESSGIITFQTENIKDRSPKSWKIMEYLRCRKTASVAAAVLVKEVERW